MPLIDSGELYRKYHEIVHDDMRLGRNLWLDARSLAYMVENRADTMSRGLTNRQWERIIPILDQGSLGSCCGNAGTGALGTQPFYDRVGKTVFGNAADAAALENFAVRLYSDATKIDPYPGTYQPTDTGSSGLAICQVLRNRKTISGYRWARTAQGFLQLLQAGPVLMGMAWMNAFFNPDRNGFIDSDPHWPTSGLAGGHEVEVIGVELDGRDLFNSVITFCNSWTAQWGDAGRFRMRLRTYEALTEVDLKQPVIS
jgi:hypothetical protein